VRTFFLILISVFTLLVLAACASNDANAPVRTVEDYFTALVEKDANRLTTLSCGEWEEDALLALDSFQAVETRLEGLACEQTGTDGDTALVRCNGSIVATYDGEDQQMDLSVRTYQVVQEGGEWLVCGTQ
jgi:hypothetical protein